MSKTWSEKKAPRQFVRVLMRFASRANLNELFENNYERRIFLLGVNENDTKS